jgi:hypothetical protein
VVELPPAAKVAALKWYVWWWNVKMDFSGAAAVLDSVM